ncbi:MAG: hypothetical protein J6T82_03000, partial [Bacteroidaceae bacterium]|nr:hypothetical protein [Bacteroidaceae bacterium]
MNNKVIWLIIWVQITEIIFNNKIFYSFLRYSSKKRTKRSAAGCIFYAKNRSRFPKARKLASSACSNN